MAVSPTWYRRKWRGIEKSKEKKDKGHGFKQKNKWLYMRFKKTKKNRKRVHAKKLHGNPLWEHNRRTTVLPSVSAPASRRSFAISASPVRDTRRKAVIPDCNWYSKGEISKKMNDSEWKIKGISSEEKQTSMHVQIYIISSLILRLYSSSYARRYSLQRSLLSQCNPEQQQRLHFGFHATDLLTLRPKAKNIGT